MDLLWWIVAFSLVGGVLSVMVAASFLALPMAWRVRLIPHLVSYAIGALLGAAFLALLPHALNSPHVGDAHEIFIVVLFGVLGFFVLEKLVLWRHCHSLHCEAHAPDQHDHGHNHGHQSHANASGAVVLVGDAVHNLVDGVLIAAAFLTDIHLGVVTALAVAAHEIPQEVGDFAVLLNAGYGRKKALVFNVLASLTTVVGAVIAYYSLASMEHIVPYILAIAASSFIYVAVADLIPGLHKRTDIPATVQQVALIAAGVITIYVAHSTLH